MFAAGLVAGPATAGAVPVTWEARGAVEFSDLGSAFFATFMPELGGTQTGDELILRITFDTDAALIRETTFPDGGMAFSFDASSLVLALQVVGRGTHVFGIDDTVPPGTNPSLVGLIDDFVTGVPELPIIDGIQFEHDYLTAAGILEFTVAAGFSSTDTTIVNGAILPLAPDPRFSVGVERQITIVDPGSDGLSHSLFGSFSMLIRLPVIIAEPGSLALLGFGLVGLFVAQRTRTNSAR
jgi:hypothetical protein